MDQAKALIAARQDLRDPNYRALGDGEGTKRDRSNWEIDHDGARPPVVSGSRCC
jgi:hypothetical protein